MTITIFVEGGCVQEVFGVEDYRIVDFDSLESGECPNSECRKDFDEDSESNYCPHCDIDWDDVGLWKALHEKLEQKEKSQ